MGVCHEKLKLLVIAEVIRNIRGGVGAGNERTELEPKECIF